MFVKKFEAGSLESALAQVKEELGPDALILGTEKKRRGWLQKPAVAVTAAYEKKEALPKKQKSLSDIFPHRKQEQQIKPVARKIREKAAAKRYADLTPKKPTEVQLERFSRFEKAFVHRGISVEQAKEMTRQLLFDYSKEDLAVPSFQEKAMNSLLSSNLNELHFEDFASSGPWVIIGPAGAGKTSVAVKLAMETRKREHEVSLVGMDKRKILGVNELAAYAKLIEVPFESQLGESIGTLSLVDGPSLPFEDGKRAEQVATSLKGTQVLLVLDANRRLDQMLSSLESAKLFYPRAVCFTRVDESLQLGTIFDFLKRSRIPLLGFTRSRSFNVAFQFAGKREFIRMLLATGGKK